MKSKKPIIYVLGVPGQFYLAKAVSKEFGRPIIGITNSARIEKKITPEIAKIFDRIYSLPDFYLSVKNELENKNTEDFENLLTEYENRFKILNNTMLAHNDRALRWKSDYKAVKVFQLTTMRFIEEFLAENQPAFCLDGVVTYLQLALRAACKEKNIPYLLTQNSRLNGHFNILHTNGMHVGMQEVFEQLQNGQLNEVDAKKMEAADQNYENFLKKPIRPSYALRNSNVKINLPRIRKNLSETLSLDKLFPDEKIVKFDRYLNYELPAGYHLKTGLLGKYRRLEQKVRQVFNYAPDMTVPFVYLPLHFSPEVSDLYFGSAYDHHAGFVAQLAKYIPSDCRLYVKEHTSMLGRRPTQFYSEINALFNVDIISPSVDTFELINKSKAVATVTGTAGWEAYILGKPVICFGNVFYNFLPSILHTSLNEDFEKELKDYLNNFNTSKDERLNAYRAFYTTCCESSKGDIGREICLEQAEDNATMFAQSMHAHLDKWASTIEGDFT